MKTKIILILLLLSLFTVCVSAKVISFEEQYQDYLGGTHNYNSVNTLLFPLYTVIDNGNNYTISRQGVSFELPKRTWIDYRFYDARIVPVYTIQSSAQINTLVTKVNASVWYLTVPFSANQYRSITDNLIDMGVFKRTTSISVQDSNETPNSYEVLPKVVNGDIRLYFNPQTYSGVVYPLIFIENTITVNNATTSGFTTANVSLNGSRWTDSGQLAINHKNDAALNISGLVGYWSMDENTGTIVHQVNTESGLVNVTNQGTWNGNATLNYTTGLIGNALAFDGVDDYVNAGNDASLNTAALGDSTIGIWVNPKNSTALQAIVGKIKYTSQSWGLSTNTGNFLYQFNNGTSITIYSNSVYSINTWYHVVVTRKGSSFEMFVNGIQQSATASHSGTPATSLNDFFIGRRVTDNNYNFNGSIDEVRIYNRALSASEIAVMYNTSLRSQGMPIAWNQTASAGNVINRTRIVYTGQDSLNNASIYARQNGTTTWSLIQANATNNTWYPITNQFNSMDFAVELQGNGSLTPFFQSLEWDETNIVYNISGYVNDSVGSAISSVLVANGTNSTTTNATGYYAISSMSNGTYNFTYSKSGYTTNYKEITINGADVTNQNITISIPQVTNLANYTPTSSSVDITWSSVTGATTYQVFNYGVLLGATSNPYYNATGLSSSTKYNFTVRAGALDGNYGANSSNLTVRTLAETTTTTTTTSGGGGGSTGGGGAGWAIETLNKTISSIITKSSQIQLPIKIDATKMHYVVNILLFMMFSLIIVIFISHNKISSLILSMIIYIVYWFSTGSSTLIETTPIISVFISAVVISLVSTTVVQVMNRL